MNDFFMCLSMFLHAVAPRSCSAMRFHVRSRRSLPARIFFVSAMFDLARSL